MTTIYKIAKKARVSIGTVDRVIHERGRVSKATTEKVQRIIREFNYRPSVYARGLALSKTFCFGVLMPHPEQDGGYWALPEVGIKRALDELKVYGVRIRRFFYDKYSHDSFRKACRIVLDSKSSMDGLLIAPVLSEDAETFLRDIPPSLPYVFIDSYVPKARCLSFIGQNSFQSGVLSAKLMLLCVRGPGPVAVIRILPMDYHIEDRINGFRSHLRKYGVNPIVVYDADCRQGERIFQSVTQTILAENPGLTGIFVPHASVGQAAQYLQDQGLTAKVHLIGYDLTRENRLHLQSGILDFVINQQPEMQGYRGIQALYRHTVLREEIGKESILPIDIVTRENLDSYSGADI